MRLMHLIVFVNGLLNKLVHSSSNLEGDSEPKEWLIQELKNNFYNLIIGRLKPDAKKGSDFLLKN